MSGKQNAVFESVCPTLGISDYEQAKAFYVDLLGFEIDWEWREAPDQPVIMAIHHGTTQFMLHEGAHAPPPSFMAMRLYDLQGYVDECNARKPGSLEIVLEPPYEFPSVQLKDPFGNHFQFAQVETEEIQEANQRNHEDMRAFVQAELDAGKPCPTPEEVKAAVGGAIGRAMDVLGEFEGYQAASQTHRQEKYDALGLAVTEVDAQSVITLQAECSAEDLGKTASDLLPKVMKHVAKKGAAPLGPPYMRFLDFTDHFMIEVGVPIDPGWDDDGDFKVKERPGGKAITGLYHGGSDVGLHHGMSTGLPAAWNLLFQYAWDEVDYHKDTAWPGVGGWQVWLNDPEEVGPENAEVQLVLPIT